MIIGHAGAKGFSPENTLLSFEKAIEMGADMIECDVRLVEDELILFHDRRMDRVTSLKGLLADYTLQQIQEIRFDQNQKVPFLEEAITTINRRVPINIEIKSNQGINELINIVKDFLSQGWQPTDFLISSFNHHHLQTINQVLPAIRCGALLASIPISYSKVVSSLNLFSVHLSASFITQEFIDDIKSKGLKVFVYTVNIEKEKQKLFEMGVDGIFTDRLFENQI